MGKKLYYVQENYHESVVMKILSISVVIPTYNSEKTLDETLSSIRKQVYPQQSLEIILADGGSNDKTFAIAKRYKAKIVRINSPKQGAEYNRAVGAHAAKNEILLFMDHDNVLPHENWLKKMVVPFAEKEVVGVETMYYHYDREEAVLGRYFSLFGVNDIIPFYLGKADRLSYLYSSPKQYGVFKEAKIQERKTYFLVDFKNNAIPTLGSNGFLVRRKLLLEKAHTDPDHFFHIDVNVDLIRQGFTRYAFVKDKIVHKTNERGIVDYFRRRKLFMLKYGFMDAPFRRYNVYEKGDFYNLIWTIIISLTLIKPFYDSLRGFLKIRDSAWFLHPFMCFGTVIIYGYSVIMLKLRS